MLPRSSATAAPLRCHMVWLDLVGSILPYSLKPWEWQNEAWTAKDVPDLRGKVALVTGANGGVGLQTTLELFRNGAHVLMGCRTEEKFMAARDALLSKVDGLHARTGKLSYLYADTSTIRQAQQAAEAVLQRGIDRLDIFIACAGRGSGVGPETEDGVEPFMATNCLGHLALLLPLLPILIQTSRSSDTSVRVVFVSSIAEQWSSAPWPIAIRPTFASWKAVNDQRRGERGMYSASKVSEASLARSGPVKIC